MTACPTSERLAAAVSGEDPSLLPHVEACLACQAVFDDQHLVRALVPHVPLVVLSPSHREALAAELLARADALPAFDAGLSARVDEVPAQRADGTRPADAAAPVTGSRRRLRAAVLLGAALAAAATIAIAVRARGKAAPVMSLAMTSARSAVQARPGAVEVDERSADERDTHERSADELSADERIAEGASDARPPRVARPRAATLAGEADYAHETMREREVVRLAGGELIVDATDARPVQVLTGDTSISVRKARLTVVARQGVISQVNVFAGTAEVNVGGKAIIVAAGAVWARPDPRAESLAAFRDGWSALRAGRNSDAVTAFDRAIEPTVAEDALYWAAIASERSNDVSGAIRRYRALLSQFPRSARAADATTALARLARD